MIKNKSKTKGITLIALVITIIILLILAGITINQLTENGLFEKIQVAKQRSEQAQLEENETLKNYENKIEEYIDGTREKIMVDKEEYENLKNRLEELENSENNKSISVIASGSEIESGTTLSVKKGQIIIISSVYTIIASNATELSNDLKGRIF